MRRFLICIFIAALCGLPTGAQRIKPMPHIDKESFYAVDARVSKTGAMEGHTVKAILDVLIDTSWSKLEKLRAIYWWEVNHISFDCKAYHHPNNYASNASVALNERKTTSRGYALFFKAMCDVTGIECRVIEGLLRTDPGKIGKTEDDSRHFWNVVTIDDISYAVDATLGAGTTDERKRRFTRSATDAWWLANRELFALSHYPDKKEWQLLEKPLTKSEFTQSLIADANAYILGVLPGRAAKGILRGREDTVVYMNYRLQRPDNIKNVSLSIDEGNPVPVTYDLGGNGMTVKIPYTKAGKQLYSLYINDKITLTYSAQVRPYKRPKQRVAATK